jgi:hypothetical protein
MAEVPLLTGKPKTAEPEVPEALEFIDATTAFLVYWTKEGEVMIAPDVNSPIVVDRPPTATEVWAACGTIQKDIAGQQTAFQAAQTTSQLLPQVMAQLGRQAMEAQQNQQIMSKIKP